MDFSEFQSYLFILLSLSPRMKIMGFLFCFCGAGDGNESLYAYWASAVPLGYTPNPMKIMFNQTLLIISLLGLTG